MPKDNRCVYIAHVCFHVCCSDCVGVCENVCCVCVGDVMDVVFFCLNCESWSCRCSCMVSVSVLSCRCCMFVSCVHPVAVLNAALCMTCSLLMLVKDARGDHMEEAYSRASLITAF